MESRIIKILQKKMSYNEMMVYLDSHKKWRLPLMEELPELIINDTIHIFGENKIIDDTLCSLTSNGYSSVNINHKVFLLPKFNGIKITNCFRISYDEISEQKNLQKEANDRFHSIILNKFQTSILAAGLKNEKLLNIVSIMEHKDVFIL